MKEFIPMAVAASLASTNCTSKIGGGHGYAAYDGAETGQAFQGTVVAVSVKGATGNALDSQPADDEVNMGTLESLRESNGSQWAEQNFTEQEEAEYQIRLDTGSTVLVGQGAESLLSVGQRVLVIYNIQGRIWVVAV